MATTDKISFSYAQDAGVFIHHDLSSEKPVLYCRPDTEITALQTVRCWYGEELPAKQLSFAEYKKSLQNTYALQSGDALAEMSADSSNLMGLDEVAAAMQTPEDLLNSEDDAPVIRMLNAIFFESIKRKASDIHIEPYEKELHIRFRLDGTLTTLLTPSVRLAPLLVSRIKVLARLDIAEKRVPQDGRISLLLGGHAVDLRVSTLPSSYGERVVLRLLDKDSEQLALADIGMSQAMEEHFKKIVDRPHGIVLVTGPTGSGKSTTLYAALAQIDRFKRNIMTIEDPVEYNMEGISQTQVNIKAGMTFARGLRAILRQDPDVVLIGEIRDKETADIAVQSSLTGHLVLSTLHTNTAIGSITRLMDMGVEPFLLTSTIQAVLAQRLVRRLCTHCRQPYELDSAELEQQNIDPQRFSGQKIYRPQGCDQCHDTGYTGRFGLFDLVVMDDTLRQMIHKGTAEPAMENYVRQSAPSLRDHGFSCVLEGKTSLGEVLSVTMS